MIGTSLAAQAEPERATYSTARKFMSHSHQPASMEKHKTGKGCLYLQAPDDVDPAILRQLIERSVRVHRGVDRAST